MSNEQDGENVLFSPPLYRQRYLKVVQIIEDIGKNKFSKLVDIGCSEMGFFQYLKRVKGIQHIVFLDIDRNLLKENSSRVDPLALDYLVKREEPLKISVLCGDGQHFHDIITDTNVVTMIEFIEHLHDDVLNRSVQSIFGSANSPNLIIVTTPNSDFNRFFHGLPAGTFRHWDHKFEWSEKQFRSWCLSVVEKFPSYNVSYDGCGYKDGICCTQIAIFTKMSNMSLTSDITETNSIVQCTSINNATEDILKNELSSTLISKTNFPKSFLVHQVTYPFDFRSVEEKLKDSLKGSFGALFSWLKKSLNSITIDDETQIDYYALNFPCERLSLDTIQYLASQHAELSSAISKYVKRGEIDASQSLKDTLPNKYNFSCDTSFDDETSVGHSSPTLINQSSNENSLSSNMEESLTLAENNCNEKSFRLRYFVDKFKDLKDCLSYPINVFMFSESEGRFMFTMETFCYWSGLPYCKAGNRLVEIVLEELKMKFTVIGSKKFITFNIYNEEDSE